MAMAANVESFVGNGVFHENGITNASGNETGPCNGLLTNGFSNGKPAAASTDHHNGAGNGYTNGNAAANDGETNGQTGEGSSDEEEVVHVCPLTRSMFRQISKKTFKLDEIDGVSLPPDNKLRELHDRFTTRDGDVFVVTYPKCGTIWTTQIVKLVLNNGVDDTAVDNDVAHPWIELTPPETIAEIQGPRRVFKSHLKYNLVPGGEPAQSPGKYIYVYRNPKDTAVSGFHQAQSLVMPDLTWEKYFERFMAGQNSYGMMLDHVKGWWEHKDADNILLVCFEDMKRDLLGAIVKIADFLECSLSPDTISSIAVQTTFNVMRDNSAANMSWMDKYRKRGRSSFMRKGSVGDWRNQFTDEQSERLDVEISRRFSGTGLEFVFGLEEPASP